MSITTSISKIATLLIISLTLVGLTNASLDNVIEGFEDGDINEYSGETSYYSTVTSDKTEGSYGLETSVGTGSDEVIDTTDITFSSHDYRTYSYDVKLDTPYFNRFMLMAGEQQEDGSIDGIRIGGRNNDGYNQDLRVKNSTGGVDVDQYEWNEGEWYTIKFTWRENGTITAKAYDSNDNKVAQASIVENNISSGGIGFDVKSFNDVATGYFDNIGYNSTNTPPSINSVSTTPSNWTYKDSVDVSANVTDKEGNVTDVFGEARFENGTVISNFNLSDNDGDSIWEKDNAFSINSFDENITLELEVTDGKGLTSTYTETQFIDGSSPVVAKNYKDLGYIFFGNNLDFGLGYNFEADRLQIVDSNDRSLLEFTPSGDIWTENMKLFDKSESEIPRSSIDTDRKQVVLDTSSQSSLTTSGQESIMVKTSGASSMVTLSTEDTEKGRSIEITDKGRNACNNPITVDTEGSETINGQTQIMLNTDGESLELEWAGNEWIVTDHYKPDILC